MKNLKIFLLGNPSVYMNEKNIKDKLSNKALGLLLYLAANKGKKFSRDKIANIFWGESGYESSSYNLRYNLWSLKKVIDEDENGEKIILSDKNTICLNSECSCFIDIEEYLKYDLKLQSEKYTIDELIYLKNLYKGNFLEGFIIKKCFDFNDWIFFEREKYQRKYFKILDGLLGKYSEDNKFENSIDLLNEMIKINLFSEELYEKLIKIYLKMGDRNSAMHVYKKCISILREELNISPKESFKELYNFICENVEVQINKINTNSKLYYLEHEKFCKIRNKYILENKKILDTRCFPLSNISYYYLSGLVEEIMNKISDVTLKDIPVRYWKDIIRVDNSVIKYINNSKNDDNVFLTILTEKNRIFSSLMYLLCHIDSKEEIIIFIEDFQWIDETSFEFINYFLFKQNNFRGKIIIEGNEDKNILKLKRYFKIENKL